MSRYFFIGFVVLQWACLNERPTRFDHIALEEEETPASSVINVDNRHIWQRPEFVLQRLGDLHGKTIADIGAGTGYFAFRFLKKGSRVIAIDIDPQMIDLMKRETEYLPDSLASRFQVRLSQPEDAGLMPKEADFIFVANTYTYIQDRPEYFAKIREAINTDGQLILIDFKKKNTPFGPPLESRLSLGQVENELIQAGYTILESDDTSLQFQYIIMAAPMTPHPD